MSDTERRERIEHWVSDFVDSPRAREVAPVVREWAPEVLVRFLEAACEVRDVAPDEVEEADLRPALLEGVARLDLPASVREHVPALCGAFLAEMEAQGRLGGGASLGLLAKALKGAYLEAASGKPKPIVAPAAKVGRNDPCPCGSGLKYKRCCLGRLGT